MPRVVRIHGLLWAVLFTVVFHCKAYSRVDESCPLSYQPWESKKVGEKNDCYSVRSLAADTSEDIKSDEISIEVISQSAGTVQVKFPLRCHHCPFYEVSLYVDEKAATSDTCSTIDRDVISSIWCKRHFHSVLRFYNSSCNDVKIEEESYDLIGSVLFKNVYSGCYFAVVKAYLEEKLYFPLIHSPAYLLKTQYSKEPVWEMVPAVGEQINHVEGEDFEVTVVIAHFKMLFQERLLIDLFLQNRSNCRFHRSGYDEDLASWTMELSDEDELIWKNRTQAPYLQDCWLENGDVKCKFINMKAGNYCLGLFPDHPDQCRKSVWTYNGQSFNHCHYVRRFDVRSHSPQMTPLTEVSDTEVVTIMVVCTVISVVALVVIVVAIICYRRKSSVKLLPLVRMPLEKGEEVPPCSTPLQSRILLLYAQDCDEFMNLMTAFRNLLQEVVGDCEVMDCFDDDRTDIAHCPGLWMNHWASRSDTKVIVVASPCAMAHQQSMAQKMNLCYKNPRLFSDLFRLGLKEVMHNAQRTYLNTFIVRFDGSDLDYITPYTRYMLPDGFKDLLKDLSVHSDSGNLPDSLVSQRLKNELDQLHYHHRKQFDYVQQMFFSLTRETMEA